MQKRAKEQLHKLGIALSITLLGLLLLKYVPMMIFGQKILYDASAHVALTIFVLYGCWFFIDQNKTWRVPFFTVATGITVTVAIQRLIAHEHNEVGILLGMVVALLGIIAAEKELFKKGLKF